MSAVSLNILVLGNNPILIYLLSRFKLAKRAKIYVVNDFKTNTYQIETKNYGKVRFQVDNHFNSIEGLAKNFRYNNIEDKFDLIFVHSNSKNKLKKISIFLQNLINDNTKIVVESSNLILLEDIIKNYLNQKLKSEIFSLVTTYDIRCIKVTQNCIQFKQIENNITPVFYLGNSNFSVYSEHTKEALSIIQRLLKKLLALDLVDLCDYDHKKYISIQWIHFMQKVCFESLMLIFEETISENLKDIKNAVPLMQGLYSEIHLLLETFCDNNKLNIKNLQIPSMEILRKQWEDEYGKNVPDLVYIYEEKLNFLNYYDILLLEPITQSKKNSSETPYLNSLYGNLQKLSDINSDNSDLFKRRNINNTSIDETTELEQNNENMRNQTNLLAMMINDKNSKVADSINNYNVLREEKLKIQKEVKLVKEERIRQSYYNNAESSTQLHKSSTSISSIKSELLRERELELKEKELLLKEKELNFRQKMFEQQLIQNHSSNKSLDHRPISQSTGQFNTLLNNNIYKNRTNGSIGNGFNNFLSKRSSYSNYEQTKYSHKENGNGLQKYHSHKNINPSYQQQISQLNKPLSHHPYPRSKNDLNISKSATHIPRKTNRKNKVDETKDVRRQSFHDLQNFRNLLPTYDGMPLVKSNSTSSFNSHTTDKFNMHYSDNYPVHSRAASRTSTIILEDFNNQMGIGSIRDGFYKKQTNSLKKISTAPQFPIHEFDSHKNLNNTRDLASAQLSDINQPKIQPDFLSNRISSQLPNSPKLQDLNSFTGNSTSETSSSSNRFNNANSNSTNTSKTIISPSTSVSLLSNSNKTNNDINIKSVENQKTEIELKKKKMKNRLSGFFKRG